MEKKTSLRDITANELEIMRKLYDNGGELTEEITAMMLLNESAVASKLDSYKYVMERIDAEVDMLNHRADEIYNLAKTLENSKKRIKERLMGYFDVTGKTEAHGEDWVFKVVATKPSVDILNVKALPEKYIVTCIEEKPNKVAIYDALSRGEHVDGARLIENTTVRSYPKRNV